MKLTSKEARELLEIERKNAKDDFLCYYSWYDKKASKKNNE